MPTSHTGTYDLEWYVIIVDVGVGVGVVKGIERPFSCILPHDWVIVFC